MLDYSKLSGISSDEVIDPVSGHSFPMSVSDAKAIEQAEFNEKKSSEIANTLLSVVK